MKPARLPVPKLFTTLTVPDVPLPTTALMLVAEFTTNEAAEVPPKLTAVVPVKLLPMMDTLLPAAAEVGEKELIIGKGKKVNPPRLPVP